MHFPKSCLHCEDPPCVPVCPTGASYKRKEDGIVLVDYDKCIRCKYCSRACPYGAREFDEESKAMTKCTLCVDRIYDELLPPEDRQPACVKACPTGARLFGDVKGAAGMNPAFSIVFFTTLSGSAQGLVVALALAELAGSAPGPRFLIVSLACGADGALSLALAVVRLGFLVFGFALPAVLLAWALATTSAAAWLLALPLQYAGLVAERWYFFAQARHPQNLYYQRVC